MPVQLGLADPRAFADGPPHAEFARRRREAPVAWVDGVRLERHSGGSTTSARVDGYWAVTRHRSVAQASKAPELFSSAAQGPFLADPVSRDDLERNRQLLVGMDPPGHTRLRHVITSAFTPAMVRRMRGSIVDHARRIVAGAVTGDEVDAVTGIAAELPLLVLADLLGIPREDRGLFLRWSNQLVGFDDPEFGGGDVTVFNRTFVEAFAYAIETGRTKRRRPGEDLMSRLVTAEVDGRRLTETEFCHLWLLLVVAGHETTRHLISGGLELLAGRPELSWQLATRPDQLGGLVEELLRWITPIMQFRRTAQRDVELDGARIGAGDKVVLYYISANRDEDVFADPDRFDPTRTPNPHLAFGVGPHFCLGSHLARLEAVTFFQELAPHLPRLRVTGQPQRLTSNFMNGLKALPVAFG